MRKYLIVALLCLAPMSASATTTHNYTCADMQISGADISCSGNTLTFVTTSNASGQIIQMKTGSSPMFASSTSPLYLSATVIGNTNISSDAVGITMCDWYAQIICSITGQFATISGYSAGYVDFPITRDFGNQPASTSPVSLKIINSFTDNGEWAGTITNICVSDTPGQCTTGQTISSGWLTIPTVAAVVASTSEFTGPVWTTLYGPLILILGMIVAAGFIAFIKRSLKKGSRKIFRR